MNCEELKDLLPLHAVDETSIEEALRLEEHVESCRSCRQALDDYRTIVATGARDLAPVPAAPPELVRVSALAAAAPAPRRFGWSPRLAAAAAAFLLVGVLVGRWSAVMPPPVEPRDAVRVAELSKPLLSRRLRAAPLSVFSPSARSYLRRIARQEGDAQTTPGGDG